ncbi:hypothetical protein [Psychroserpens sp.]
MSKETFLILKDLSTRKTLKAGDNTIKQGGMSSKVYFLTSGLMRSVRVSETGKEYTKIFIHQLVLLDLSVRF